MCIRDSTRGSEALVTWGVQFNRETLLEDTKGFHGWGYVHRVGGSLRLFLVGPEMAPLTVNDRAVSIVVLRKETRTRRQHVIGGVRFTSSERILL